ncbi:putative ABC transporter permease protein [Gordonia hirsuta DSM 44140 = NBRC 16056]|uniref:Putative ABC transporter permease protein n=1 Tax=Gordonia hirsuta DSM 44140 = NBRC 16056 TaxID=1121927 RepID=L7LC99_9ACTN|nr:energy-coupling factor transporter transmembrane protein EcfT [Gordonia hirsuta]GAC57663.1 putative ABC transporter permease protein [Gordonia hirsuta DSM 44140 = NBRC 16056]
MTLRTPPLRQLPGDSVVHQLWAGTKLLIVLVLGLMTWVLPTWPSLAFVAVFVLVFALLAGIPLGALPRPPWWFWGLIALGAGITALSSGIDGVLIFMRGTALGLIVLAMSILVVWTTPMAEIAPAIARLLAPLKLLRMPVEEWAVCIALSLRGLPLLMEEMRLLRASYRLRPSSRAGSGHPSAEMTLIDMVVAAMSSAMRRAAEMGEAITARGGTGRLTAYPSRPGRADWIALGLTVLACGGAIALTILL